MTKEKRQVTLINLVGCKIRGLYTESEIKEYTDTGKWRVDNVQLNELEDSKNGKQNK